MTLHDPLVKPFLKWAGGKRQLLPEIRNHIPEFKTYFEPFVGAGAVLFDQQPARAMVGDFNTQLITTYQAVQSRLEELCTLLQEHKAHYGKDYYYQVREQDRHESFATASMESMAARFIFLNKTCYNGLYRVNSRGFFNVPFGRYVHPAIYEEAVLRAVSHYFNTAHINLLNGDFEDNTQSAKKGDFVYFDPPYHSADKSNFTSYQAGGFSEGEQERLAQCYRRLSKKGVRCLLSNADTPFIQKLYKGFTQIVVPAKRAINSKANGRGHVNELLIRSW